MIACVSFHLTLTGPHIPNIQGIRTDRSQRYGRCLMAFPPVAFRSDGSEDDTENMSETDCYSGIVLAAFVVAVPFWGETTDKSR